MNTTPANDNYQMNPRDWYHVPSILLIPDEKPHIVACAFYLGQSKSWLPLLAPGHALHVARRKDGRRYGKLA